MTGYLFYHSLLASALLMLAAVPGERFYRSHMAKKRRDRLLEGFRDLLYSISGSVSAGFKMPQAIGLAAEELSAAYGPDSDIAEEAADMDRRYRESHAQVPEMFEELSQRSGLPEIAQFSAACSVCSQCGGDLEDVCMRSASLLLDKLEFRAEVSSMIAEKKLDIAVLTAMPVCILFFLNMSSPDYLDLMYSGLKGRLIMSFCLLLIAAAMALGLKIVRIEI